MKQEDKELLLKDLCARLPYHPFAYGKSGYACNEGHIILVTSSGCAIMTVGGSHVHYFFNEIKLYLRPMSSMTEDERKEYNDIAKNTIDFYDCPKSEDVCFFIVLIDWLNAHHFDYRGLIERGLAIKVTPDNNPYE